MRHLRRSVLVALLAGMVLSTASAASAITNGRPDGGEHPYVGVAVLEDDLGAYACSGALLSPTVFLTAGHCTATAGTARVSVDEDVDDPANPPTYYPGTVATFEDFCVGCGTGLFGTVSGDVGLVLLQGDGVPTSVVDTYATLPDAGAAAGTRKAGVDLVGYGAQSRLLGGGPPVWDGVLSGRQQADAEVLPGSFKAADELLKVTANPGQGTGGQCFGDSGGPVLEEGTSTVLAVNSYVTNGSCAGVTYATRIDRPDVLAWIQAHL